MRRLLASVVLLLLAVYAVGAVLFLTYDDDGLSPPADAVFVLAGDESRLSVALALIRDDAAPVLVVSEDETGDDVARGRLCRDGRLDGAELVCRRAVPFSTRGEARLIAALAEQRGWDRLVVVTSHYHLFRTKRLLRRCTDADLVMRGSSESAVDNLQAIPFEWAKLALAETFRRGC